MKRASSDAEMVNKTVSISDEVPLLDGKEFISSIRLVQKIKKLTISPLPPPPPLTSVFMSMWRIQMVRNMNLFRIHVSLQL